jgi:hypothetical protein
MKGRGDGREIFANHRPAQWSYREPVIAARGIGLLLRRSILRCVRQKGRAIRPLELTRPMKRVLLSVLLISSFAAVADAQVVKTMSVRLSSLPFPWPTTARESAQITKAQITSFLNDIEERLGEPRDVVSIDNFVFANLSPHRLSLVALPDESGRGMYNALEIVSCQGLDCFVTDEISVDPHDLAREVQDLDGSGRQLIVARKWVGGYQGADTRPIYTHRVLEYRDDSSLVDVSSEHRQYFEKVVLPEIDKQERLLIAKSQANPKEVHEIRAEAKFARLSVDRSVFGNHLSGLNEALQWESSTDKRIQMLAVKTFEEIDDPAAYEALDSMSRNKPGFVGLAASGALSRKNAAKVN